MSSERATARPAIMEAAFRLLEAGVPFRLEDVAKEAGVSRQAIYLHFKNRNDLVLAVAGLARTSPEIARRLEELPRAGTPRALVEAFVHAVTAMHRRSSIAQLTVAALCRADRDLAAIWAERPAGRLNSARDAARRIEVAEALALPADRGGELLHALTGPGLFDQLVTQQGWSVRAYESHLTRLLLVTLVVPGREDVTLPPTEQRTRNEHGTDSGAGRDARDDAGRVEPRGRRGVRRPVHG